MGLRAERAAPVWLLAAVTLALIAVTAAPPQAHAQARALAVVTHVVDGQRLDARLADGRSVAVRLIGIETPAAAECGGNQARSHLERLVEGRAVTLENDLAYGTTDRDGRYLLYVDRPDGVDAGEDLLRVGWARVPPEGNDFRRLARYSDAQREGRRDKSGVWDECNADFHRSSAEVRQSAAAFVRRYYARLSRDRYATAWGMLGRSVRRNIGTFRRWRAGHRSTRAVATRSVRARLTGRRAVVTVSIRSRDRDACNGRAVQQRFRGRWLLTPRGNSWVAARLKVRKTGGGRVRTTKSECPRPKRRRATPPAPSPSPSPSPPSNCQGYSPCLPPGPDVDCEGGSGDGPRYTGQVQVNGSDPYDLDRDGDGTGCD